jgi:hypothetical protein
MKSKSRYGNKCRDTVKEYIVYVKLKKAVIIIELMFQNTHLANDTDPRTADYRVAAHHKSLCISN